MESFSSMIARRLRERRFFSRQHQTMVAFKALFFFLTISFDFLLLLLFSFFVFAERKEKNFFSRQYIF